MVGAIRKRLDRLAKPKETLRVVTLYPGEPEPTAAPGELLVVIKKFCTPEPLQ